MQKSLNLFQEAHNIAIGLVPKHVRPYDNHPRCFDLTSFLDDLESKVYDLIDCPQVGGTFSLSSHDIARFVWAHMAILDGGMAYPDTFFGMPVLD